MARFSRGMQDRIEEDGDHSYKKIPTPGLGEIIVVPQTGSVDNATPGERDEEVCGGC